MNTNILYPEYISIQNSSFKVEGTELNLIYFFFVQWIQKVTKPLHIEHVNKENSYKIYKRHINYIRIKYKYTETIQYVSLKYKYTRKNRRLQMSINDKDSYEEGQMDISKCPVYIYNNMTKTYTWKLQLNKVCR
jgi:hypothetical protein